MIANKNFDGWLLVANDRFYGSIKYIVEAMDAIKNVEVLLVVHLGAFFMRF